MLLESAGAGDFILPTKTPFRPSVALSLQFNRCTQSKALSHRHTDVGTDLQGDIQSSTNSDLDNDSQEMAEDKEKEAENSNLVSLLVKPFQSRMVLMLVLGLALMDYW